MDRESAFDKGKVTMVHRALTRRGTYKSAQNPIFLSTFLVFRVRHAESSSQNLKNLEAGNSVVHSNSKLKTQMAEIAFSSPNPNFQEKNKSQ